MGRERKLGRARDFGKAHTADGHLASVLPHVASPLKQPDQHRASFETAAPRLPQDEVLLNAIKEVPHPEEARSAISKHAGCSCSPSLANSFTGSRVASFIRKATLTCYIDNA